MKNNILLMAIFCLVSTINPDVRAMQAAEQEVYECVQPDQKRPWQQQIKEYYRLTLPHIKDLVSVLKTSAVYAYKGSEWCCKTVMPSLYKSLVFVLKHWVEFVKSGGEFSFDKKPDVKQDSKIDVKKDFKVKSPLSEADNLYILEVAKTLVKREALSPKTRKNAIALLRKALKYGYGYGYDNDLEDLLVAYFDKILKK